MVLTVPHSEVAVSSYRTKHARHSRGLNTTDAVINDQRPPLYALSDANGGGGNDIGQRCRVPTVIKEAGPDQWYR